MYDLPHPAPPPVFLVTIDTEGDNLWARSSEITTRNSRFLPRFQQLCERYGIRPTWLTNWEMVNCPEYRPFARDVLDRNAGEIGMHLHAWNNPPLVPLTEDDNRHHPYLFEYPEHLIRQKVTVVTDALEDAFNTKMVSHRAGRFGFDEVYARILVEHGYKVDCSITPHWSWKSYPGNPGGRGGADFRRCPEEAYFLDLDDICRPGDSTLLELPVTITEPYYPDFVKQTRNLFTRVGLGRIGRKFCRPLAWLYPMGNNHSLMPRILEAAIRDRRMYVEFMIHSSELMPGGSPTFTDERAVDALYHDLELLFASAHGRFVAMTLAEYHQRVLDAAALARPIDSRQPSGPFSSCVK